MPLYTYRCNNCDLEKYVTHSMNDTRKIKCKFCKRLMKKCLGSNVSFNFKGTGFYETDYKNKGK